MACTDYSITSGDHPGRKHDPTLVLQAIPGFTGVLLVGLSDSHRTGANPFAQVFRFDQVHFAAET